MIKTSIISWSYNFALKTFLSIFFLCFLSAGSFAQEEQEEGREIKKNRISPLIGYVFVPEQIEEIGAQARIIPTIGLDYERRLSEKWAIGSFNDLELSSYFIKDDQEDEGVLEREFVFISTICAIYTPIEYWSVYLGAGYEFEKNKNFFVARLGTEYEVPIRNDWDVAFGLSWDYKEVYNSIGFTIAFGKRF